MRATSHRASPTMPRSRTERWSTEECQPLVPISLICHKSMFHNVLDREAALCYIHQPRRQTRCGVLRSTASALLFWPSWKLWMGYGLCTRTLYTIFRTPPSIEPTKMPSCPTAADDSVSAMPLNADKILPVARSSTCRTPPVTPAPSLSQDTTTWTMGAQGERQLILTVKMSAHAYAERKPHKQHVRQGRMPGKWVPKFGL
jgi:hypothetical protein